MLYNVFRIKRHYLVHPIRGEAEVLCAQLALGKLRYLEREQEK